MDKDAAPREAIGGDGSPGDRGSEVARLEDRAHRLTAERDALEQVIEHAPEASLVMLDRDFNFLYVNSTYAESCGFPKEAMLGRNHFAFFPNDENEEIFRRAREIGEPVVFKERPFVFEHDPARGVTYWDWTLTPIKDRCGEVESFVFSLVDVTDRVVRERLTEALARLDIVLHSSLDTEEIVRAVIVGAQEASGCDSVGVALRDGPEWVAYFTGEPLSHLDHARFSPDEVPVAELAAATRHTVIVNDVEADETLSGPLGRFGLKSVMNVPLLVRDEVIGVIGFDYHEAPVAFTTQLIGFAERVGASLSLAIANARTIDAERRRAGFEDALNRMLTYFISARDPDEVLREVVEESVRATGADYSIITIVEKGEWVVTHAFGEGGEARRAIRYAYDDRPVITEAAQSREVQLVDDSMASHRTNKSIMRDYGIGAFAAIPLVMRSELLGVLELVYQRCPVRFDDAVKSFLDRLMLTAAVALEEAQRSAFERQVSETLQEALIVLPDGVAGLALAHEYHAASDAMRVGGDFYDVFELENGLVGVTIGDVSGKGLKAAALTSLIKNTVRARAAEKGTHPSDAVALAHTVLYRGSEPEVFASVFFGLLDRRDGRLQYCNAGHPAAGLLRSDGSASRLGATSPIVGALADSTFRDAETWVEAGDTLFLYTDGLTEARHEGELFGEDRLFATLEGSRGMSPAEVLSRAREAAAGWADGRLTDDVALLAVGRPVEEWGSASQLKMDFRQ